VLIGERLTHKEIERKIGRLSDRIHHTLNHLDDVKFANQLLDLFFEKLREEFRV
jgi:hypothetical protein